MTVHCPACGVIGKSDIQPDLVACSIDWTCPNCRTDFEVRIRFHEKERNDRQAEQ